MQPSKRPLPTRLLGIDYGLARIGLALSDERKIIASPFVTFQASKRLEETLLRLVEEIRRIEKEQGCSISEVVVGIPLKLNGQVGLMADEVKLFAEKLGTHLSCPIRLWDERLTSLQAERSLRSGNIRGPRTKELVDKVTAAIILQSYLDKSAMG